MLDSSAKERPILSIIIPHYNCPGLLKKLLDSIPISDEIEIIIVDDKSDIEKEYLRSLMEEYSKRHTIKYFENATPIKSAGTCRNIGIAQSSGIWILFADADDYFTEGFYDIVKKYCSTDLDVVFFAPTSVKLNTHETGTRHVGFQKVLERYLSKSDHFNELLLRYGTRTSCFRLINRRIIEEHNLRFDEVLVYNDDMFSVMLGRYLKKFAVSNEVIYCIGESEQSLSQKTSLAHYYSYLFDMAGSTPKSWLLPSTRTCPEFRRRLPV